MKRLFRELKSSIQAIYLCLLNKNIKIAYHQNWSRLSIDINGCGKLTIGNYLKCRSQCSMLINDGKLSVGNNCFFNSNVSITCLQRISIGNNVQIGNNTVIIDHNHDYINGHGFVCKDVEIGDNTWIGANCVILPGVHIREGTIIAAGSVVNRDVDAYTVVAGNPAKIVKEYH